MYSTYTSLSCSMYDLLLSGGRMLPCTAGWLLAASHQAVSFGSSADKEREGQREYGHSVGAICSTARGCERCLSPPRRPARSSCSQTIMLISVPSVPTRGPHSSGSVFSKHTCCWDVIHAQVLKHLQPQVERDDGSINLHTAQHSVPLQSGAITKGS